MNKHDKTRNPARIVLLMKFNLLAAHMRKHIGTYPKVMVSILELKADDTTKADLHDRQLVMSK